MRNSWSNLVFFGGLAHWCHSQVIQQEFCYQDYKGFAKFCGEFDNPFSEAGGIKVSVDSCILFVLRVDKAGINPSKNWLFCSLFLKIPVHKNDPFMKFQFIKMDLKQNSIS